MQHTSLKHAPCIVLAIVLTSAGCVTAPQSAGQAHDVILEASEAQVRAALVHVLTEGGYEVVRGREEGTSIRTDYRTEIGTYNWLYYSRFGMNRSRVAVTLTPESGTATRVTVQVWYEGKGDEWMPLAGSWVPYDAALSQSATNTIRLVKNELGLF